MDLTTRCPQCGTIFPISLDQLQLRKGYIRCINCAHIFDGYEAVVPGGDASAAQASPAPAAVDMPSVLRQRPVKEEPVFIAPPAPERASLAQPAFSISTARRDAGHAAPREPVFRMGDAAPAPSSAALHAPAESVQIYAEPRTAVQDDDEYMPEFLGRETPRYRGVVKWFWGVLIIAGLALLLAQMGYVYRAQIANQVPALRPVLVRACVPLHCTVPYARRLDLISIMSSSLKASTSAGGGAATASDSMRLQFTLRNTYDKPQEWPTLVLDLTDFSGTLVVRKNLAPESYLTPEALRQPFAASSEVTAGVSIVLNGLKVNGYQLNKFFP